MNKADIDLIARRRREIAGETPSGRHFVKQDDGTMKDIGLVHDWNWNTDTCSRCKCTATMAEDVSFLTHCPGSPPKKPVLLHDGGLYETWWHPDGSLTSVAKLDPFAYGGKKVWHHIGSGRFMNKKIECTGWDNRKVPEPPTADDLLDSIKYALSVPYVVNVEPRNILWSEISDPTAWIDCDPSGLELRRGK